MVSVSNTRREKKYRGGVCRSDIVLSRPDPGEIAHLLPDCRDRAVSRAYDMLSWCDLDRAPPVPVSSDRPYSLLPFEKVHWSISRCGRTRGASGLLRSSRRVDQAPTIHIKCTAVAWSPYPDHIFLPPSIGIDRQPGLFPAAGTRYLRSRGPLLPLCRFRVAVHRDEGPLSRSLPGHGFWPWMSGDHAILKVIFWPFPVCRDWRQCPPCRDLRGQCSNGGAAGADGMDGRVRPPAPNAAKTPCNHTRNPRQTPKSHD